MAMSLRDAFLLLQLLPDDDPALAARVNEAAAVVNQCLARVVRKQTFAFHDAEDASQDVFDRLCRTGPRIDEQGQPLWDVPETDAAVEAYLWTGVRNQCISNQDPSAPPAHPPPPPGPAEGDWEEVQKTLAWARSRVVKVLIPRLEGKVRRAGDDLERIADKKTTIDAVLRRERKGSEKLSTTRSRVYKRCQRALDALHGMADHEPAVSDGQRAALRQTIDDLRLREAARDARRDVSPLAPNRLTGETMKMKRKP